MNDKTLDERLLEIQSELKAPKNQRNSFGNYNYRSAEDILEAVKPLLKKQGVTQTISDDVREVGGRVYVVATVTLRYKDESREVVGWAREAESKKGMDDSQVTGATSSYARKYALNGMYAIDDNKDADTDEFTKATKSTKAKNVDSSEPTLKQKTMIDSLIEWHGCSMEQRDAIVAKVKTSKDASAVIKELLARKEKKIESGEAAE